MPILEEKNFTMIGIAQIQFYSKIPTKHIRFHARKLLIQNITVKKYSSNSSKLINKYIVKDEKDFIDLNFLQLLIAGETYVLHVKYTIPLHEEPMGFFRSSYIDRDTNETR